VGYDCVLYFALSELVFGAVTNLGAAPQVDIYRSFIWSLIIYRLSPINKLWVLPQAYVVYAFRTKPSRSNYKWDVSILEIGIYLEFVICFLRFFKFYHKIVGNIIQD